MRETMENTKKPQKAARRFDTSVYGDLHHS